MIDLLDHEREDLRAYAARVIGYAYIHLADYERPGFQASAIPALIKALHDPDAGVREATAKALEDQKWQPAKDENAALYWIAMGKFDACAAIGAPAVGPLITALGASDIGIRRQAAGALAEIARKGKLDEATRRKLLSVGKEMDEETARLKAARHVDSHMDHTDMYDPTPDEQHNPNAERGDMVHADRHDDHSR